MTSDPKPRLNVAWRYPDDDTPEDQPKLEEIDRKFKEFMDRPETKQRLTEIQAALLCGKKVDLDVSDGKLNWTEVNDPLDLLFHKGQGIMTSCEEMPSLQS